MDTLAHHDVIVIGGGQAGLAIGYHLARAGRQFTILDAADTPAAAWRSRWDSLKLFTPARYDGLPAGRSRETPATTRLAPRSSLPDGLGTRL